VIDADPMPAPVTCGAGVALVAPAAIVTLAGAVTFVVSLLASVIVTPPAGAGADRVTVKFFDRPKPTDTGVTVIPIGTFTVAVADVMPVALAVIVAEPLATPVTVTVALVAPAAKFTVAGTVATPVALEFRFTVKPPAGAFPVVRLSVRVP
jgi:hypothetical protein